ncbi:hypothetical protein ON010_g16352 [Phytophthora cinnamomi]|nr:hypothetical protein ON010_g16352 [Phytophthora cinnamomi]
MIKGCAISKASRGSIGSKNSDKLSWKLSVSRRSVGQVHSSFSLHTRFAKVLAEDRQDAFDPNATAIKVWQQLLLLCILLEAFLLPYGTAFHPEAERAISKFSVPIVVCETVFTLDLYIQACTGYYSDGNLIRDKKRTVQRYVYSWQFVVDLVALLPVRLLGLLFQPIVPWVSLLKLIRWSRLPLLVSNLDELYSQYFVALKFAKVLASTLYLAHVLACCESGNSEAMSARINQLMHVLSFHSVPESQKAQAIEYLKRYYTDTDSSDRDTVKLLCPSIANDIKVELLKATIAEVSLFNGCSDDFLIAMTSLLEMIAVPAQTTLFSVGDYGDAMYVVHSGVFATICDSVTVRELRKGSCFGEISVFSSLPRTATIVSTTYAIVYKLSRFHCERVLEGYPECASVISVHVQEIVKRLSISDDLTDRAPGTTPSSLITPLDKPKNVKPRRSSATSSGVPRVGKTRSRGGSSGSFPIN